MVTQGPRRPSAESAVGFLQSGERLVRIHRFRFARPAGCALGLLDLTVEESVGDIQDPSRRCVARPEHPTQVARPELTIYGESVEDALRVLIEKLRGRRPADIFLPLERPISYRTQVMMASVVGRAVVGLASGRGMGSSARGG